MAERVRIDASGGDLRDRLFDLGVEFPCGGDGLCGGCRIRVIDGDVPITPEMRDALSPADLDGGWRLGCVARAGGPVTVEIEQWSAEILTDNAALAFEPRDGFAIAIDLGTTTLVAQLVDLRTGEVADTRTALNPQARYGADVMSRIRFDLEQPGVLRELIRDALARMVAELADDRPVQEAVIVGNTVMHHLFLGHSVAPLASAPFRSPQLGAGRLDAREIGWPCPVEFQPCVGGFVGSDLLAGVVATGIAEFAAPVALLDLGTNGEVAVAARGRVLCASTAAGPAFEGGRIRSGMRAGAGAIDRVDVADGKFRCHVIGGVEARGLCGSGLVDAAAAALALARINARGRLAAPPDLPLCGGVSLVQADIRELQLAKGAIRAGLDILAEEAGADGPMAILLAGAFGNYIRIESARAIGLIPGSAPRVDAFGNTALRGARLLALRRSQREALLAGALSKTTHVELASSPAFHEHFATRMSFCPD